jgi:hypothetical protein
VNFFIEERKQKQYSKNMKVIVYHEVDPDSLHNILNKGIKCASEGEKTKDKRIQKTDMFLDTHRPDSMVRAGVSRSNNLYGYPSMDNRIVDITNGEALTLSKFLNKNHRTLVKLQVEPSRCFVSDLDLYDTIKRALELDEQDSTREHLAEQYWHKLVPLNEFETGSIKRPEVVITYDIEPADISLIEKRN